MERTPRNCFSSMINKRQAPQKNQVAALLLRKYVRKGSIFSNSGGNKTPSTRRSKFTQNDNNNLKIDRKDLKNKILINFTKPITSSLPGVTYFEAKMAGCEINENYFAKAFDLDSPLLQSYEVSLGYAEAAEGMDRSIIPLPICCLEEENGFKVFVYKGKINRFSDLLDLPGEALNALLRTLLELERNRLQVYALDMHTPVSRDEFGYLTVHVSHSIDIVARKRSINELVDTNLLIPPELLGGQKIHSNTNSWILGAAWLAIIALKCSQFSIKKLKKCPIIFLMGIKDEEILDEKCSKLCSQLVQKAPIERLQLSRCSTSFRNITQYLDNSKILKLGNKEQKISKIKINFIKGAGNGSSQRQHKGFKDSHNSRSRESRSQNISKFGRKSAKKSNSKSRNGKKEGDNEGMGGGLEGSINVKRPLSPLNLIQRSRMTKNLEICKQKDHQRQQMRDEKIKEQSGLAAQMKSFLGLLGCN